MYGAGAGAGQCFNFVARAGAMFLVPKPVNIGVLVPVLALVPVDYQKMVPLPV